MAEAFKYKKHREKQYKKIPRNPRFDTFYGSQLVSSYRACGSSYQFIIAPQENMATAFFEDMINCMNQLIIGYNGSWIMVHTIFLKFWSNPKFGKRSLSLSLSNPLILSHEMIRIRQTKAGRKGNIASIRHSPVKSYWALAEKDQQELSSIDGKTGWRL